ncbi:hypothetical protein F2Q70_00015586 [Brassica cretica]|uniref:Uncharacterized protein n=1 Tax=Brassica cretica TaxID=69181 RepID=A0A8S9KRU5_BRACR|nr:hypothetical protein F2Q70_00015586 [Brassica cretica]KAF2596023.1 hypothetical protein F2Q68_00008531 [Brassica cretica]
MTTTYTLLTDLRAGRCPNTAEVCLLRFWEARNINKGKELMSVDMLLIDENFMPPASVDTSQDLVLHPPVA